MGAQQPGNLNERVRMAAERALAANGYAAPIDLLMEMQLLAPSNVRFWDKGGCPALEPYIQGSPGKLAQTFEIFRTWAQEKQLEPVKASLHGSTRDQSVVFLTVSESAKCSECGGAIGRGSFLFREKNDTRRLTQEALEALDLPR